MSDLLTREELEDWRDELVCGYTSETVVDAHGQERADRYRDELNSLCDMALRALKDEPEPQQQIKQVHGHLPCASVDAQHSQAARSGAAAAPGEIEWPRTCPCLYPIEPCDPDCTCRNPFSSRGCARCCSYGSLEQRTRNAQRLADAERLLRATDASVGQDDGYEPEQNKHNAVVQDEPEGWVSVPLEPTGAMIEAAERLDAEWRRKFSGLTTGATVSEVYKAMLAAKPSRG